MAVFMVNSCKFKGCSLIFQTLSELIQHIEEAHIEVDPKVLERQESEQPAAIALSQVLRFYGGAKPKKSLLAIATNATLSTKKSRHRNNSVMSSSASIRSLTPTSSEYDFDDEDGMDSYGGGLDADLDVKGALTAEQQWTNQLILRMMSNKTDDNEKPFACPIKTCRKRYKNINGVKYHARHGHKREARMAKLTSKCFCGKSFHSAKQLDVHTRAEHSLAGLGVVSPMNASADPNLSVTVKDEPSVPTSSSIEESKTPLSIIHPITFSGGMLLTPSTARHLKSVNKNEILVAHKLSSPSTQPTNRQTVASLVTSTPNSLVTPPTTPHKPRTSSSTQPVIKQQQVLSGQELDEQQRAINEKVARALAAAKHAMEAAAAKGTLSTVNSQQTIITMKQ